MSNRKYNQDTKNSKKNEQKKIVESQKQTLDKFVTSSKKDANLNENLITKKLIPNTKEDYEKITQKN